MKGKKIIIILIIINILTIGIIYNFIKKEYLNNKKIIVKAMTEGEYEDYITSLNQSHIEYVNYIEESKTKIASAITDMGVNTSNETTLENMANNIKSIARDASSISYDNSSSTLTSTNIQGAVDELNDSLGGVLLWQNPNPSNTFGAETITLLSDDYDYLKIFYRYSKNYNKSLSIDILKGNSAELDAFYVNSGGFGIHNRVLDYMSDTEYKSSSYNSSYTSTSATTSKTSDNTVAIPLAIYGFKF